MSKIRCFNQTFRKQFLNTEFHYCRPTITDTNQAPFGLTMFFRVFVLEYQCL